MTIFKIYFSRRGMMRGHMMSSALVMRVDRPFFLGIWDDAAKTLVFAGVIRDLT